MDDQVRVLRSRQAAEHIARLRSSERLGRSAAEIAAELEAKDAALSPCRRAGGSQSSSARTEYHRAYDSERHARKLKRRMLGRRWPG